MTLLRGARAAEHAARAEQPGEAAGRRAELAATTAVRALIRTLRSLGQPSLERTKAQLRAV